jgi:hypothetical protein
MIKTLEITGFRCFKHLKVDGLARVNLIVGKNNHGKSSLLEAIYTLVTAGDPAALADFMIARNETLVGTHGAPGETELDLRRLFNGHALNDGSKLSLLATEEAHTRYLGYNVVLSAKAQSLGEASNMKRPAGVRELPNDVLVLSVERLDTSKSGNSAQIRGVPIGNEGGVNPRIAGLPDASRAELPVCVFLSTDRDSSEQVAQDWSEIVLTADEQRVEECLRLIEPTFSRTGYVGNGGAHKGTFRVKLEGQAEPIPLGSMGSGMSRLLALAVSLVRCKNGVLLVDEIDTGLHHSILGDMWKFVLEVAEKLNVQVFATTHSLDCIRGLAQGCRDDLAEDGSQDRVSMHRIERDRPESVHYMSCHQSRL